MDGFEWRVYCLYGMHVSRNHIDSVDVSLSGRRIVIGLSSLEGNTWDGGLTVLSDDGVVLCSQYSSAGISKVRFSGPNFILAARDDGNVVIYSADKLEEMQSFWVHDDLVSCVAYDPHHESHFASCGWDGSIHLWDWLSKAKPVSSYIDAHQGHVNEVTYSPFDSNLFCSVGWDKYLRLWDIRENPSSGCSTIVNVGQISTCVSYESSDSGKLLVGTDAGDVLSIDPRSGPESSILCRSRVHKRRIRRITPSPASTSLSFMTASDDTTFSIFCNTNEGIKEEQR